MRVLFCGSRTWKRTEEIRQIMSLLPYDSTVIHGGAPGADSIAGDMAEEYGIGCVEVYEAQWEECGRAAGPIRNQRMIDEGRPDMVFAFRCAGRSPGTDDMVRRARKAGIPVVVVTEE